MSSSTLVDILEVTTYIPTIEVSLTHPFHSAGMAETTDYELSGCYVKYSDYEELRRMYLRLLENGYE